MRATNRLSVVCESRSRALQEGNFPFALPKIELWRVFRTSPIPASDARHSEQLERARR